MSRNSCAIGRELLACGSGYLPVVNVLYHRQFQITSYCTETNKETADVSQGFPEDDGTRGKQMWRMLCQGLWDSQLFRSLSSLIRPHQPIWFQRWTGLSLSLTRVCALAPYGLGKPGTSTSFSLSELCTVSASTNLLLPTSPLSNLFKIYSGFYNRGEEIFDLKDKCLTFLPCLKRWGQGKSYCFPYFPEPPAFADIYVNTTDCCINRPSFLLAPSTG